MGLPALSRQPLPGVQRGAASVAIAMLIVFILAAAVAASMLMSGSSVRDAATNEEQISALFLAESGLERAVGILSSAASSGTMAGSVCSGISSDSPPETLGYPLGRGHFKYVSATPKCSPTGCDPAACTGAACTGCSVSVTGTVDTGTANSVTASRTLNLDINMTAVNGVSGFGTDVTMALKNTSGVAATAVFNLAWRRQGGVGPAGEDPTGGNASAVQCAGACVLRWNDESSSGSPSGGSLGSSIYNIPNGTISQAVTQTINTGRNYAEVGALFPGLIAAPDVKGSYWNDAGGGPGNQTVNNASGGQGTLGKTNSGVVAAVSGTCTTPSASSTNTQQACNSWCYGADTLVFGVSARSASTADQITAVTFNTDGNPSQNIGLTQVAHFPTSGIANATGDIYSEIWYAHNPNLSPTPVASSASSYSAYGTGAIGATFTGEIVGTTLTITGLCVDCVISPNSDSTLADVLSSTGPGGPAGNVAPGTTIVAFISGTPGGNGQYTVSVNRDVLIRSMTAASKILHVTACTAGAPCYFAPGNVAVSGTNYTISSQLSPPSPPGNGQVGDYLLSGPGLPASVASSNNNLKAGAPGTTIYVPSTSSMPAVTTPATRVAIFSGPGTFAANTTVTNPISAPNSATNSFTVSPAPTTALDLATICSGACAFFDDPSSTGSTTEFTVTRTAGTDQWAGGFTCLSGVDRSKITPVTSSVTSAGTWREVVQ